VNFITNVTKGYSPLTVQFTDKSDNATERNWDFGDGATSIEQNPTHTYSIAGIYTVNLTVSNANGTTSKIATINVQEESSSSSVSSSHSSGSSGSGLEIVSDDQNSSVVRGSTDNITEIKTVKQPENSIQSIEQKNGTTGINVVQKSEKTQSPNISGEGSKKAPDFEIIYGIVCLLSVFLFKRK
jgi:PKD repeat protein